MAQGIRLYMYIYIWGGTRLGKIGRMTVLAHVAGLLGGALFGELLASAPGPVLDFGPERGPGKGTMADLGPLIRHLVSTRLPSGGRAAFLSPLSPMHGTRPSV